MKLLQRFSDEAIKCLQIAVELLIDTAKYARAGTVLQWMAEIYEDNQDFKMAGETYAQVLEATVTDSDRL